MSKVLQKIFFFQTHLLASEQGPQVFSAISAQKLSKMTKSFLRLYASKKEKKNFFLCPIGRGHIVVDKLLTLFFFSFFFLLKFSFNSAMSEISEKILTESFSKNCIEGFSKEFLKASQK